MTTETKAPGDRLYAEGLAVGAPDACWLWTGATNNKGYGVLSVGENGARRGTMAHRYAWERANGAIAAGVCVCHRCDNPPCCNPAHLFLGTKADNMRDMTAKGRRRNPPPPRFLGEDQNNAKLSNADARDIRGSGEPLAVLAARHGVSMSTISRVRNRKAYAHA